MKTSAVPSLIAVFCILLLFAFWTARTAEPFDCCSPPLMAPGAARFLQGAQVTVYINSASGFTSPEIQSIKAGIEDWNDEPNYSGVRYTVVETPTPPAPGGNNTIIASYNDVHSDFAVAALTMHLDGTPNGNVIWGTMVFNKNIREGSEVNILTSTARHEIAHSLGLDNAQSCTATITTNCCPPGSTIMNPSYVAETPITPCDNAKINTQATTYSCPPVGSPPGSNYRWNTSCCCWICSPTQSCACGNGICATWSTIDCAWRYYPCPSPVLVDINGDGFSLTDNAGGVPFDLNSDGEREFLSWTAAGADDAWLVLDRDNNGEIDNGAELFGNYSPQPEPQSGEEKNGFRALAEYDKAAGGGNSDGFISAADDVFSQLRLWQDIDHNGRSELWELHTLSSMDIGSISLDYKESRRTDANGNQFRYRAKVFTNQGQRAGRYAYDVFLLPTN